ncbi:hypothetical protein [Faecalispora anaeroviscerum]|uniref:hypothetical protein n=1 Tax=Faecalispora anaeroviscerum TaxID=2991836 RepID=UPI0024B90387|nr:hypothetical protein [Faecalispora anaeroviscerum]
MKQLSLLNRISTVLNFVVIALAVFSWLASGWNNPTVMTTSFVLMCVCFWASTIVLITDSVQSGSYQNKRTRASSIVRDLFALVAAVLLTVYTVVTYFIA